jgi:hypothetical protein
MPSTQRQSRCDLLVAATSPLYAHVPGRAASSKASWILLCRPTVSLTYEQLQVQNSTQQRIKGASYELALETYISHSCLHTWCRCDLWL